MTTIRDRIRYRRHNSVDPEEFLLEAGAVRVTEDGEDLALTDRFVEELDGQLGAIRERGVDESDLASLWGVEPGAVQRQTDRSYPAYKILDTVWSWPTEAALAVDIAVDRTLEHRDGWEDVPPQQRYRIAQSLRGFQDRCLFCDGRIVYSDEPVDSCCADVRVLTLYCSDCDRRFMEFATEDQSLADAVSG